jgi:tetratricopeptide (TPR) repeat protein
MGMKQLVWALVAACGSPQHAAPKQDPGALADRAMDEAHAGKLDDAARDLQRAGELGNPDAWNLLAMLNVYRGDEAAAGQAFAHEPGTDPLGRGWFLFAEGKLDDALAAAQAASVAKEPDHQEWVKAAMLPGGLLVELGRYKDAIEPLTVAVTRVSDAGLTDNPYFRAVPIGLLAWAQLRAGDAAGDDSLGKLEALGAAHPDDKLVGLMLPLVRGQRAIAKGDLAAAEQALSACPPFAMCLYHLADVQTQRGETEAAAATRAKIAGLFTLSPPEIYYRRRAMR